MLPCKTFAGFLQTRARQPGTWLSLTCANALSTSRRKLRALDMAGVLSSLLPSEASPGSGSSVSLGKPLKNQDDRERFVSKGKGWSKEADLADLCRMPPDVLDFSIVYAQDHPGCKPLARSST